jgi:starch synthase
MAPHRANGHDETIVHLTAEYLPYAQTGGLAEAVRGLATEQARSGRRTIVFLPYYRSVRLSFRHIEPAGEPFPVHLGNRIESARVYRDPTTGPGRPEVYLVECGEFFDRPGLYGEEGGYPDNHLRFAFFCRAALHWIREVSAEPVVLPPHDWHAALAPVFLRGPLAGDPYYDRIGTVLTVHNAGYQGHAPGETPAELGLEDEEIRAALAGWHGESNLLKAGLLFADMVTTVSPTHATELLTPMGGFGIHEVFRGLGDRFVGILNSIDSTVRDPRVDPCIAAHYDTGDLSGKARCKRDLQVAMGFEPNPDVPLLVMVSRLVEQKGLDLVLSANLIPGVEAQWAFLGEGEQRYRDALFHLAEASPDRVACRFGFSDELERKFLAGADFLLMPSLYEPCGLTQMRAQRYGAPPVVRRVGGLADTVEHEVTGLIFDEYSPDAFAEIVSRAIDMYRDRAAWERLVRNAMSRDFDFQARSGEYKAAYVRAVERRSARRESGMA